MLENRTKESLRPAVVAQYLRRCERNPKYSLRSFARLLGIQHSTLSRFFHGKRNISPKTSIRICEILGLPKETFVAPVRGTEQTSAGVPRFTRVSLPDDYHWYHDAVAELTHLSDFAAHPRWIARRLGISEVLAEVTLRYMVSAGRIKLDDKAGVDQCPSSTTIGSAASSMVKRNLQREILDLAVRALDETPPHLRSQQSLVVAMAKEDLGAVREIIADCQSRIDKLTGQSPLPKDCVYQCSFSLFPLTSIQEISE